MALERGKVLITGGTGFIGRNLIEMLKEKMEIINLSLSGEIQGVQNISLDLTKSDLSPLESENIDYVIHLAAFSSPARSQDEKQTLDLNYEVTAKLLDYFSRKNIKKFIFMSSYAVYEGSDQPLSETSPLKKVQDNYAKSKILAEQVCQKYIEKGMPIIAFRLSNCYGPHQQWKKEEKPTLIPQLISQAIIDKKIEIYSGSPVRDYIYADDVSEAFSLALKSDYIGILNLGTGIGSSGREVAEIISSLTGVQITDLNKEVSGPKIHVADISKISSVLNWKPKVSFQEGLSKTLEFYKREIKV